MEFLRVARGFDLLNVSVAQMDDPVRARGNFGIVRDHDHRQPLCPEHAAQQVQHGAAGF